MFFNKISTFYQQYLPIAIRQPIYNARKKWPRLFLYQYINMFDRNIRHMSERLLCLKDAYKGHRSFIMGNGPSLNKMDLNVFKNEYVWGSNRSYLLFDRINWRPSFYVAVDKRVVPDNAVEINRLAHDLQSTQFFFPTVFRYDRVINSRENLFWFNEKPYTEGADAFENFSLDPTISISSVRTVTISALQLAVFLGFNPIYLIGCDTSYTIPRNVIIENDDTNLIISSENNDPNHFSADYFGAGKKWHDPHVDRMVKHYEETLTVCNSIDVKIYNATVGGMLEVFPRVYYLDLF